MSWTHDLRYVDPPEPQSSLLKRKESAELPSSRSSTSTGGFFMGVAHSKSGGSCKEKSPSELDFSQPSPQGCAHRTVSSGPMLRTKWVLREEPLTGRRAKFHSLPPPSYLKRQLGTLPPKDELAIKPKSRCGSMLQERIYSYKSLPSRK